MAKSRRVAFELPPASYRVLEQAAEENGINVQAAASLILQAALARRISGLVPKRPAKAGAGGGAAGRRLAPSGCPEGLGLEIDHGEDPVASLTTDP